MKYSSQPLAQLLTVACECYAIRHIVISPGSRNAPLIINLNNINFKTYSIVDERCAAFFAMGMAEQLTETVALVCTSGSALLNYYPAISEAYYRDISLVIISADRPSNKIDIGDGQTIRQENVFANHIGKQFNIRNVNNNELSANATKIAEVLDFSTNFSKPVHINVPFEEPLYDTSQDCIINKKWFAKKDIEITSFNKEVFNDFQKKWKLSSKKMILIGQLNPNELLEVNTLKNILKDRSIIVLTESLSNVYFLSTIDSIDKLMIIAERNENLLQHLQPEILLSFGGMVVSKKIKSFLRKYSPEQHYHVSPLKAYDTYQCLTHHFKISITDFIEKIAPTEIDSNYRSIWLDAKKRINTFDTTFLPEYSDFAVFKTIFEKLPENYQVHLSNSSTIRYAQLFTKKKSHDYYCNRGTSGIDGSTSTAIGNALYGKKPTVLITGDISFFYDSNALWNNYIRSDFRVIIVNNKGGGIFRILNSEEKKDDMFESFFETKHKLTAKPISELYDFSYQKVETMKQLMMILNNDFWKESKTPKILEIFTPREINDKVLKILF